MIRFSKLEKWKKKFGVRENSVNWKIKVDQKQRFPTLFLEIYKWWHCTTRREYFLNFPEHTVILLSHSFPLWK